MAGWTSASKPLQQIRASAAARLAFLEEQRRGGGP